MAATINGKPSIFKTPEVSPAGITTPDYETRIGDFLGIANEMVTETEPETDEDFLNDPETQAELNAWYDSLDTPEAEAEFDGWVTEQEREAFEAHLCSQYDAEIAEMEALGEGYLIGLNTNHDAVWQAGGVA